MNVGDVVGNYRITEVLGEGGMGVVYLGSHKLIGREAAIKVLLPSLSNKQEVVQRFFNEAKTTTSIKHPGIVEVFDFGYSEQGHAYIVMERLEGETLEHRIRRLGRLPAEKAIGLFQQIARALGAAHGLNVVHRDLKPANIYIVSDPDVAGGERAKILDFGIAKLRNDSNVGVRTASGQLMGAPDYMAPEQCLGAADVDPRADLYAFGCMMFHAVTGKPPFASVNFSDVLAAHVSRPAPRASSMAPVPAALDDLIHQLMKKAPDERPQSTDELLTLLKAASGGVVGQGAPQRSKARSAPPPIPASARRTVMASSQPPPLPVSSSSLPPDVIDSAAPLPPLPRPKAASQPPPVPRAAASAKTLYTSPSAAAEPAPARSAAGPFHDPRLAKTRAPAGPVAGNPVLSVPGPQGGQPPIASPPARPPAPVVARPAPQPPPGAAGPRGTMAMPSPGPGPAMPSQRPMPAQRQAGPTYPQRQPEQPRPYHPVAMGPRQGNAVRPLPPSSSGTAPWKVVLGVLLIAGASAGGFFVYKSATRKGHQATSSNVDAGVAVAATDAAKVAPADATKVAAVPIDAAPVAASSSDAAAAATAAMDAAVVATVADAASVKAPADAAVAVAVTKPDAAAPVSAVNTKSGRIVDPELKSAAGGDDGVETVTLTIESRPPGADVIRKHDNLLLGQTPMQFVTRKFNANENFQVRLGGHYSVDIKMSTFRNGKRLVPLLAKPK